MKETIYKCDSCGIKIDPTLCALNTRFDHYYHLCNKCAIKVLDCWMKGELFKAPLKCECKGTGYVDNKEWDYDHYKQIKVTCPYCTEGT